MLCMMPFKFVDLAHLFCQYFRIDFCLFVCVCAAADWFYASMGNRADFFFHFLHLHRCLLTYLCILFVVIFLFTQILYFLPICFSRFVLLKNFFELFNRKNRFFSSSGFKAFRFFFTVRNVDFSH